jgi:outer membrane lipoprotein SlyB
LLDKDFQSRFFTEKEFEMTFQHVWYKSSRITLVSTLLLTAACSQPLTTREKSTLAGGGIGAVAGTVIGAAVGAPGAGAAIGGALGAAGGAVVGDQMQSRDTETSSQEQTIQNQQRVIQRQREELNRAREDQE